MSRPVGTYYNAGTGTGSAPTSDSAPARPPDDADAWDWSSPTAASSAPSAPAATATATTADDSNNSTTFDWTNPGADAAAAGDSGSRGPDNWYSAPSGTTSSGLSGAGAFANSPMPTFAQPIMQQQPGTGFYQASSSLSMQAAQLQQQQQPLLSGAMDSSAPSMLNVPSSSINGTAAAPAAPYGFSMFMPSAASSSSSFTQQPGQPQQQQQPFLSSPQDSFTMATGDPLAFVDEAPLLEELGINVEHILLKTRAVVVPFSRFGGDQLDPSVICKDADLAGPVAFALMLGGEMVLAGKLQFGYIYGFGLFGCVAMTFVVNLMSPSDAISFWTVTSILGYSLLPVNLLALLKIVVINLINLQTLGRILGIFAVAWSTTASTRLLELGCGLRSQRYLIAYPIALLYSAFVLMTIF
jgi:protein YIPF5/7